jgi:hypothetical protein
MEGDSMTDEERREIEATFQRLLAENKRLRAPVGTGQVQTHHAECWQQRHHHACAVSEIERLRAEIEEARLLLVSTTTGGDDGATLVEGARRLLFQREMWVDLAKSVGDTANSLQADNDRLRALLVSEVEATWEAMPNPEYRSAWQKKQWVQARLVALGLIEGGK